MLNKLKEKMVSWKKKAAVSFAVVTGVVLSPVVALAEEPASSGVDMTAISSAMNTAFAGVQTNALSMIASIVPYAISIASVMILINLCMRAFSKLSGTRH